MTSPSDDERRKETRLSPGDLECDVEGARFAHVLGVTLGGHGMRVMTDRHLPDEHPVQIVFHLSDEDNLEFQGQVVWSEEKNFEFTHRFISGVRFVDPPDGSCARLHDHIESLLERERTESDVSKGDSGGAD